MRKIITCITVLTASLLLSAAGPAFCGAPLKINFQGRLDENGRPAEGTKTLVFKIYDAASGGSLLWTGQPQTVTLSGGVFSALLSAGSPAALSTATFSGARYVELSVDGVPLSPRQEMVSAPYALVAQALAPDAELPAAAIGPGSVGDAQVSLTTAAISSGRFTDDRVAVSTAAFPGGFNGAYQLVQLDPQGKLPGLDGSALRNIRVSTADISGAITDASVSLSTSAVVFGKFSDNRVMVTTGAVYAGLFGDDRVNITTAAVTAGVFSDERVRITTGAVALGRFSDDRVLISTAAFVEDGGDPALRFNGADQIARLNGSGVLAISGGISAASLQISGALGVGGAVALPIKVITYADTSDPGNGNRTYFLGAGDHTVLVDATTGNAGSEDIYVQLPDASASVGRIYTVERIDDTSFTVNSVFVVPSGEDILGGGEDAGDISTQWRSITVQSAGDVTAPLSTPPSGTPVGLWAIVASY